MPALHIRRVDAAVVDGLKRRAARNNRSLEGELREVLRTAALEVEGREGSRRRHLRLKTVALGGAQSYGRDEIYGTEGR